MYEHSSMEPPRMTRQKRRVRFIDGCSSNTCRRLAQWYFGFDFSVPFCRVLSFKYAAIVRFAIGLRSSASQLLTRYGQIERFVKPRTLLGRLKGAGAPWLAFYVPVLRFGLS